MTRKETAGARTGEIRKTSFLESWAMIREIMIRWRQPKLLETILQWFTREVEQACHDQIAG
jgi:hypothetical protein